MGLFDKMFKSQTSDVGYAPKCEQDAWVALVYACMSVDGDVSDMEIDAMSAALMKKVLFRGYDMIPAYKEIMTKQRLIGSKVIIDSSVALIADNNKATVFAIVVDVLLSDGILGDKEQEIIDYICTAMKLDDEIAAKIVEVYMIRMKDSLQLY